MGHLRFSLRPLTPQPGDYRNFMLHVLLAVFKIRYIFAFCSAAGRTELPELCSAAGNAPSMAWTAIFTASLAYLNHTCCKFGIYNHTCSKFGSAIMTMPTCRIFGSAIMTMPTCRIFGSAVPAALFGQHQLGSNKLQTYLQTQPQYFSLCCQKLISKLKFHRRSF